MRKIVVFNLVSVDGYFAGKDGNIDWHQVDDEFNKFAIEQTSEFGTLIFGATTFKIFEDFWPKVVTDPGASEDDRKVAQIIDDAKKIVFSRKLKEVTWKNTKVFDKITPENVIEWKSREGDDAVIFGSGQIIAQFTKLGLIDEYRLMVNPVILGEGKNMFDGVFETKLKLIKTREFKNGNILLYYTPTGLA